MANETYLLRIQEAIDFIEENLTASISIDSVASHAGFSTYHFHRLFSGLLGESVKDYIRKRRLSLAARTLVETEKPILEIALNCDFKSQESFTRAFTKMFGVTPGRFRKSCHIASFIAKPAATAAMVRHLSGGLSMQPKIISREAEYAVGMGDSFPEGSTKAIGELWDRFKLRMSEISQVKAGYALGVCSSHHLQIERKEGDSFIYTAALPATSIVDLPPGMVSCTIAGGRYAVFTHKGSLDLLPHTISYIWGTWVPSGEYKHRDAPDFELYDERFDPQSRSGEFDIYVPIE